MNPLQQRTHEEERCAPHAYYQLMMDTTINTRKINEGRIMMQQICVDLAKESYFSSSVYVVLD